jgi:branched-chain amino acid transport system permease protein
MTAHYFGVSFWWGLVFGLIYVIVLGLIVGIPTLRLRADYLAIVTIATAEIVRLVVRSVRFKHFFGGSDGINNFSKAFRDLNPFGVGDFYGIRPFRFSGYTLWTLLVAWALVALGSLFVWALMRSPWGRVVKAIREDEDAVRSLGKNVYTYKMQSLIIGGVLGMFSGMIFALDRGSIQPDNYSRDVTFYILTALVLGGVAKVMGSIVGPMMFWGLFVFSDNFLRDLTDSGPLRIGGVTIIQSTQVGAVNYMLVGLGLILLMTLRPQGIFGNRKEMALDGR